MMSGGTPKCCSGDQSFEVDAGLGEIADENMFLFSDVVVEVVDDLLHLLGFVAGPFLPVLHDDAVAGTGDGGPGPEGDEQCRGQQEDRENGVFDVAHACGRRLA